jgi:hypothetical protein
MCPEKVMRDVLQKICHGRSKHQKLVNHGIDGNMDLVLEGRDGKRRIRTKQFEKVRKIFGEIVMTRRMTILLSGIRAAFSKN